MKSDQWFKKGDREWFRKFADDHGITFQQLKTEIFATTNVRTLESLWAGRHPAGGTYADVFIWYARAKAKEWQAVV